MINIFIKILVFSFVLSLNYIPTLAQNVKPDEEDTKRFVSSFGFQFSPIIPNNILQNNVEIGLYKDAELKVEPYFSYLFGMEIRHDFNKRFSLQSGINYVDRKYTIGINKPDTSTMFADFDNNRLHFIGYEIPLMGLVYIRLSKHLFMDNAFGVSMNFYPSDIAVRHVFGRRRGWVQGAMVANVGWEYRTFESGTFYLGAIYQMNFSNMMNVLFYEERIEGIADTYLGVSGNYFAINLKYYFDSPKNRVRR